MIIFSENSVPDSQTALTKNFGFLAKQLYISLLKHHLKDSQPGKSSPLRFGKGYFCNFWHLKASYMYQFWISKWFPPGLILRIVRYSSR